MSCLWSETRRKNRFDGSFNERMGCRLNKVITMRIDGSITAPSDYNVLGSTMSWIEFKSVDGLSIRGGFLDGKGTGLWACKAASGKSCPTGVSTLGFTNSNNIKIYGLTSLNSQLFHIVFNGCTNVKVQGVKVTAAGNSPNTDVREMIAFPLALEAIEDVICGPGHGISIGSLGRDFEEEGVQNVTVKKVTFINTQNGVRIKSFGRPSKGFVNHVVFQHATMINVQNPIVIDQNYCPDHINCHGEVSGVQINDVLYQDIHGTSATGVAVKFDCSKKNPCKGIILEDVKLNYKNQQAKSQCANAGGNSLGLIEPSSCL
ncbi:OLC1v1007874C1 [Oldenlandia corymbosa var. corymbosa]|uniref:OLC1v1007874C1 n=1 Tax=Oldenlandia corymbosa var. corymbosa TaxID=529605 RepID=A0AAV1DKB5_OLDCO|nr:OLC1v1007874C1 [Oldenlandia corymbosa var. corymbosa]